MIEINNKQICENCFAEITAEPCSCCGFNKSTYINDPSVLPCGSILMGRYIIGKVLGKGGFGITYLAYDSRADKTVAVKEFYPNGLAHRAGSDPTVTVSTSEDASVFQNGAEKFYNEAKLVARFNGNPGIVSVYEFFYENDTVYFSMEYLHGKTLKKHIDENGAITEAQAVSIADSVSSALLAAHSANIMHRDISPDNIMLCDDGTVKIIDFGAARQLVSQGSQNLSVILKQGFAPIEQYQKKGKQGPWTDIYSLGATLYYALTLDTIDDPMSRMENDEEYQSNKHGISAPLWELIRTSTMLKAADRYQDIFLFRNALSATGIASEPIISPKSEEVQPAITFQTAQPFNTQTANSLNTAASSLGVTVAMEAPAPQPPVSQTAAPVAVESKSDKKKLGMFVGIAAAAVVLIGVCAVVLINVLGAKDDANDAIKDNASVIDPSVVATSSTPLRTSGSEEDAVVLPDESEPEVTTTAKTTTTKATTTTAETTTTTAATTTTTAATTITTTATTTTTVTTKPPAEAEPEEITEVNIGGTAYAVDTKILDISGKGLTTADIKQLQYMTSLTHIELSDNRIDDLSVLGKIPTIQQVTANNNLVSDLSFASKLPELGILVMNNNNITDISPLSKCKNLKKLWLVDNAVTDISALKGKNMLELGLNNSPISDLSPLKGMTNLYQLHLYNCGISDISALSSCTGLKTLYLDYNYISDYSPLVELQLLEVVNLSGNIMNEDAMQTLYGLQFLKLLYLNDMGITDDMAMQIGENLYSSDPENAQWYY